MPLARTKAPYALLCIAFWNADLRAVEPSIRNLSLRGLQIGGVTTLVVDGDELGATPRLLLPFNAKQQLKPGGTKTQAAFEIALDADVEPGYHQLRVVTDDGVSAPVVVAVDRLPQQPLPPAIETLPAALHGVVNGPATVETHFTGKAGQKVLIEVEAQRLGGKLRPVVHLLGPKKLQIAWAWPTANLHGDTRLEATLPDEGLYTLTLHDLEHAPPGPGFFRLRVGQWSAVDQVFPPVMEKGKPLSVELIGSAVKVDVPATLRLAALPLSSPREGVFSGPRPFVRLSSHSELIRQAEPGKVQELPAGLVGVSGRLLKPHDEDRYLVPVAANTKVRFEVFAERYGSPLDAALVVRNGQGAEVARAEEGPGTVDPILEYAVPDKVTSITVSVVDAQGRGGPRGVYRLVVTPQGSAAAGFQLFSPVERLHLPVGGRTVFPVLAERSGYEGRIELSAEGLPAGVRLEGADIPEGADGALVTVLRGDAAPGAVIARWIGKANGEERLVSIKNHSLERIQPWLANEIALATNTATAADFQIDWRGLPADAGLVPASKLALPFALTKPAGPNIVRLSLLTSQSRAPVNDPNQALRLEKPIELPANANEGEAVLLIPSLPAATMYDVALQAELLTPDKKTVLAIASTPVRRMTVRHHLTVRLDNAGKIEATLDPKNSVTIKLPGQIERREGLTGEVTFAVAGLPSGARVDSLPVKPGETAFTLSLVLAPNTAPGEITGITLSVSAAADAKQPNIRVRSRDVPLPLLVLPPKGP